MDFSSVSTHSKSPDESETTVDSPTSENLQGLRELVADLNKATDDILHSGKRRYSKVAALVACWPDNLSDRVHIRQSATELCAVLKHKYNFEVDDKPFEIGEKWPHRMFNEELLRCLDNTTDGFEPPQRPEDPTKLFILYYGGHAVEKHGKMVWRPNENAEGKTELIWTGFLDLFTGFDGDILFLFDCCYAGNMIDYGCEFKRRCEVFCASNKRKKASGELQHSFTQALVRELDYRAEVHRVCEIKRLHSTLNLKANKKAYNLKVDPFWDCFARWDNLPICLAPLTDSSRELRSTGTSVQELEDLAGARVIFKATFEDPEARPLVEEWKEFVRWRPRNLKDIKWYVLQETEFQTLFQSNSISAIISIPMILWDSMPKRTAYEFICVGQSTNLLDNLPRRNQAASSTPEMSTLEDTVSKDKIDEEVLMMEGVLEKGQRILGEKHPDTIRSMADLAVIYHMQGRYKEAEVLIVQALDLRREVLGEKHPNTIRSMADLAVIYYEQGRYKEAEILKVQALDLRREVLGEKHPDTIRSMADLAVTCHMQDWYKEAEVLMVQALDLQQEVLGEKHPDTIRSMVDLAVIYYKQGRYNKAEYIYRQVLDLRREVLREKHPDMIRSMVDLAVIYYKQGRYNKAEYIYRQVLDLRREVLGEKHPDTIRAMADLAVIYHAQGQYKEAEVLHKTALNHRQHILGENHPDTIQSFMWLASTRELLQHMQSIERPVQHLAITQVLDSEERKPHERSFREFMHARSVRNWIYGKSRRPG